MDVTISSADQVYLLPPTIGQLYRVAKVDSSSDLTLWELDQKGYFTPDGFGVRVEGNTLRLGRKWQEATTTLRMEYVPNGEVGPIAFRWTGAVGPYTTSVTLPTTLQNGEFDTRPNAYAGYYFRTIIPSGTAPIAGDEKTIVQERLITSYNPITRVVSLSNALDPTIDLAGGETLDGEIVPVLYKVLENVLALRVAQDILATEGMTERYDLHMKEYRRKMRSVQSHMANIAARSAGQFDGKVPENNRHGLWFPITGNWGP
jgi:hypothetical protein